MDFQSFFALVLISLLTETGDAQLKKTTVSDADLTTIQEKIRYTNAAWIFFLPNDVTLENIFNGIDIPMDREVFIVQIQQEDIYFKEVFRVHSTFPLEVHRIGNWTYTDGLQWTRLTFFERRNDLQGLKLNVTMSSVDPVVILYPSANNNNTYSVGTYFGAIWSALEKKLNFSSRFLESQSDWGISIDGTWSGMIEIVSRKEADVGLSAFSMTKDRLSVVDILPPIITNNLRELKATGHLNRLRNLYWYNELEDKEPSEIEVSFEDTLPMLTILLSGYLIGIVFLAIERIFRIMRDRGKDNEIYFSEVDSVA